MAGNVQHGWITDIFGSDFVGHAADIGANDGVFLSNTIELERLGWTVLCVEANPAYLPSLAKVRKLFRVVACSDGYQPWAPFIINQRNPPAGSRLGDIASITDRERADGFDEKRTSLIYVPVLTLDSLLDEVQFPKLDLISVDVEGGEMEVLRGADLERWKPRVVIAEALTPAADEALRTFLGPLGYEHLAVHEYDHLFALPTPQ